MELIAFIAFFLIEGFVFLCGYVVGWNRCCKSQERENRLKRRTVLQAQSQMLSTVNGDRC